MEFKQRFIIKGSTALKIALANEIKEAAGVKASDGLQSSLNRGKWDSENALGVYEQGIGYAEYSQGTVFNLPEDYNAAKKYAVEFFTTAKKYTIDGYPMEVSDNYIKFGCKSITSTQLNEITRVMEYLNVISDYGDRKVIMERNSITIGESTVTRDFIEELKTLVK